jgi:hypothetical protein
VDACEPPSNLQRAFKESARVDAEYNFPTQVPKTRVNMTKRHIPNNISGKIQGRFSEDSQDSGKIQGKFSEGSVNVQ